MDFTKKRTGKGSRMNNSDSKPNAWFVGNPYALLIDGVVTEVVFMHEKSKEEIAEELARHEYDEVVICEDYGHFLGVGFVRYNDVITPPKEFESWVYNDYYNAFFAPVNPPNDGNQYAWNEDLKMWEQVPEDYYDSFRHVGFGHQED